MLRFLLQAAILLVISHNAWAVNLKALQSGYIIGYQVDAWYAVNSSIVDEIECQQEFAPNVAAPTLGEMGSAGTANVYTITSAQENASNFIYCYPKITANWTPLSSSSYATNPSMQLSNELQVFGQAQTAGRSGYGYSSTQGNLGCLVQKETAGSEYVAANFSLSGSAPAGMPSGNLRICAIWGDNSVQANYDTEKEKWYVTRHLKNSSGSWTHQGVTETINSRSFSASNTGYTLISNTATQPCVVYTSSTDDPRDTTQLGSQHILSDGVSYSGSGQPSVISKEATTSVTLVPQASLKKY